MADYELIAVSGDMRLTLPIGKTLVVGRSDQADLVVADSTISRRHAELVAGEEGVEVRDLGSSNGTAINGTRVAGGRAAQHDTVAFGNVSFRVERVGAARPAEPEPAIGSVPGGTIVRQVIVSEGKLAGTGTQSATGPNAAAAELEQASRRLGLLLEISQKLSGELDLDRLLSRIAEVTFETMKVDRVVMLLTQPGSDELVPVLGRSRVAGFGSTQKVPRNISTSVIRDRVAILSDNTQEEYSGNTVMSLQVMSAMASPLMAGPDEVLGLIYVDNLTSRKAFTDEDLQFLVAFAGIAAIGIRNSRYAEQVKREAMVRSNFERYFAPDVAAQIAGRLEAVQQGGDKRTVVVLFSDIRGFTSMSETMSPDMIADLLSGYFTEMVDIIFEHDGTLDKFIGDAVMALWGAPIPLPDPADRALSAAINMQLALREMNERWRAQGRRELSVGIGINIGEVFAGNIGSHKRLEYTVLGDAVNVASRLCGKAGGGEILISERLFEALRIKPEVESVPPMELKNVSRPLPVLKVRLG